MFENINDPEVINPPEGQQRWRPEVIAFADAMEAKLRANEHKGGWKHSPIDWLIARLVQEVGELAIAVAGNAGDGEILHEASDVANFAMMLADVSGELRSAASDDEAVVMADFGYERKEPT